MIKDYGIGDRIRFDNKQTAWFVRASLVTPGGRYE